MWRWVKHWIDWVRDDLLLLARTRRSGFTILIGHETNGQPQTELPIPWSADAVLVEVLLRLPPNARRKSDFTIRFPGFNSITAESVRTDPDNRQRVMFRFPVPSLSIAGELLWKQRVIGPVTIPVLSANSYLAALSIAQHSIAVRLGSQTATAHTFVVDRCKGLVATAVVKSHHPLALLTDLGVNVEFTSERSGQTFMVPVRLTAAQRSATEAILTVVCPRVPRRPGGWSVVWRAGERILAADRVEAIGAQRFEDSVQLLDTRFAVADRCGPPHMVRVPPAVGTFSRVGPCFLVSNSIPGLAGLCRLGVFAILPGFPEAVQLLEDEVLVTDAPTVFAPGLVEAFDLVRISAFELRLNGRVLGTAALSPVPSASITSEGGFKQPREFTWSAAAEEELLDRLSRLG